MQPNRYRSHYGSASRQYVSQISLQTHHLAGGKQEVCAYECHEHGWKQGDKVIRLPAENPVASKIQEYRYRPEGEYCKRLVCPGEVSPQDIVVHQGYCITYREHRDADIESLEDAPLLHSHEIGDDEP